MNSVSCSFLWREPGTTELTDVLCRLRRLLMAEVYGDTSRVMDYYGNGTDMADFPFNFLLVERLKSSADLDGNILQSVIGEWREAQPNDTWANWVLGNHDQPRVASRVGEEAADALNMLLLTLPGTPVTYYGEELAMTDVEVASSQRQDPAGRDPQRTPMQWSAEANAGFSEAAPWLPINANYKEVNVETQQAADTSHLKVYRALQRLRSGAGAESLTAGEYKELLVTDKVRKRGQVVYRPVRLLRSLVFNCCLCLLFIWCSVWLYSLVALQWCQCNSAWWTWLLLSTLVTL